ncbi:MAG: hypothetical protein ABW065_09255 [Solirubrobacterales bacterium]
MPGPTSASTISTSKSAADSIKRPSPGGFEQVHGTVITVLLALVGCMFTGFATVIAALS